MDESYSLSRIQWILSTTQQASHSFFLYPGSSANTNSIPVQLADLSATYNKTQLASYFEYLIEGLFLICWELSDTRCPLALALHTHAYSDLCAGSVAVIIMTLYVKGVQSWQGKGPKGCKDRWSQGRNGPSSLESRPASPSSWI
jgi:hypothetical protein